MGKIKLKHGTHEIELDGDDAFIESQPNAFYERIGSGSFAAPTPQITPSQILTPAPAAVSAGPAPAPAEFYRLKSKGKSDGIAQASVQRALHDIWQNTATHGSSAITC